VEIVSFETLPSTQKELIRRLKNGISVAPLAVISANQTDGVGSRDNIWSGGDGNLFTSIAIPLLSLPTDLPLASSSIYFAYFMESTLRDIGETVWLKWPNDIYAHNSKIGGVITQKIDDVLVVGIGINLKSSQNGYSSLESDIEAVDLLDIYLDKLEHGIGWKQVFSQYKIKFEQSKAYYTHQNGTKIDMKNAILCDDGSLSIGGRKVYSLR
jgi:BirA family biotin operon repressor/biotin-[acetyl-CoA-carboxylase] ligase